MTTAETSSSSWQPATQETPGIPPQIIYQQSSEKSTSSIYGAVYSGIPVYEIMCRNVAVMRRKDDSYLNATQILKVAGTFPLYSLFIGIDKGRRTKILEKEIMNGQHEKVQGGYGKYQGTWIPFERGLQLAIQFNVDSLLAPLLDFVPPSVGTVDLTPSKEQMQKGNKDITKSRKKSISLSKSPESIRKTKRKPLGNSNEISNDNYSIVKKSRNELAASLEDLSSIGESKGERHRAALMAMFLNNNPMSLPDILISDPTPLDFDINIVIDEHGFTAVHWAAALGRIDLLKLIISKGGNVTKQSNSGETALIRAVKTAINADNQTFPELLSILHPSLCLVDVNKRSVLHHIVFASAEKGRSVSCRYYLECVLEFLSQDSASFSSLIDFTDILGDTALNISARLGFSALVDQLIVAGANPEIENLAGLKPSSFGFVGSNCDHGDLSKDPNSVSVDSIKDLLNENDVVDARIVFPSIATNSEINSVVEQENLAGLKTNVQDQLKELAKDLGNARKKIDFLKEETRKIPELEQKIRILSHSLEDEIGKRQLPKVSCNIAEDEISHDGSIESLINEITRLRSILVTKEVIEQELRKEIVAVRIATDSQEFKCKQIISLCCGIPIENVESLLDPLLQAIESDDPDDPIDAMQMNDFMNKMQTQDAYK